MQYQLYSPAFTPLYLIIGLVVVYLFMLQTSKYFSNRDAIKLVKRIPEIIQNLKILSKDVLFDLKECTLITVLSTDRDGVKHLYQSNHFHSFFTLEIKIDQFNRQYDVTLITKSEDQIKEDLANRQDISTYTQLFGKPQVA
jgi:hypothetical protein